MRFLALLIFLAVEFTLLWNSPGFFRALGIEIRGGDLLFLLALKGLLAGMALRAVMAGMQNLAPQLLRGADPARLVARRGALALGCVFVLIPGYLSDLAGLTLLLPGVRRIWTPLVGVLLRQGLKRMPGGMPPPGAGGASPFGFGDLSGQESPFGGGAPFGPGGPFGPPPRGGSRGGEIKEADFEVVEEQEREKPQG